MELHLLPSALISPTNSINSSHLKARKANLILPLKCHGQSISSLEQFWAKIFRPFKGLLHCFFTFSRSTPN